MANHTPCGIELPQVFFDGPTDMEHIRKFAIRAEILGFDSLWLQERIIGDFIMLEPVTLLSYIAAITTKIRLGTSVILLPLRNPVQLAKAYSTLDVISGGRAIIGVGLGGGHLGSHENVFGYTREGRVTRFSEAVQIMKRLWTEPKASFHGRYWNFDNISMEPKPVQKPHLPIIFGGHHENALRRAVKYADGWMTNKVTPEEFKSQWTRILAMAKEEGRDPSKIGSSLYHNININENRQAALDESKAFLDKYYTSNFSMKFVEGFTTAGSPKQCIDELKAYFAAGIEHITLRMTSWDQSGQLKRFLDDVVPAFK